MPRSKTKKCKDYRKRTKKINRRRTYRRRTYRRKNKSNKKKKGGMYPPEYYKQAYDEDVPLSYGLFAPSPAAAKPHVPSAAATAAATAAAESRVPPVAAEAALVHEPFSNESDFVEKESKYMETLKKNAEIEDKVKFNSNKDEQVLIEEVDMYLKGLLNDNDKETVVHNVKREYYDYQDALPGKLGRSVEKVKGENYKVESIEGQEQSVSFSLLNEKISTQDGKHVSTGVLSPLLRKVPEPLVPERISSEIQQPITSKVFRGDGAGPKLCWHFAYSEGTNKVLAIIKLDKTEEEISEQVKLPFTLAMYDLRIPQRANISHILNYMGGIVDLKNIKVYVNFNQYETENQFKEYVFKIACSSKDCMYSWVPITDWSLPSVEQLQYWVNLCKFCRDNKLRMIYHCGAGGGRTIFMTFCNLLCMIKLEAMKDVKSGAITPCPEARVKIKNLQDGKNIGQIKNSVNDRTWNVLLEHNDKYIHVSKSNVEIVEQIDLIYLLKELLEVVKKYSGESLYPTKLNYGVEISHLGIYDLLMNLFNENQSVVEHVEFLGIWDAPPRRYALLEKRLEMAISLVDSVPRLFDDNFNPFTMSNDDLDRWLQQKRY